MVFRKLKPILSFCSADELSNNRLILGENSLCNYGGENNCCIVMNARTLNLTLATRIKHRGSEKLTLRV